MITSEQISILAPYMAVPGIRPSLSKIAVNKNWLTACDSFRLIRTRLPDGIEYADTRGFPDVDTFMQTDIEWKNITRFMQKFMIRLGVFGRTTAIRDGNIEFPQKRIILKPNYIFDDSDGASMSLDLEHPFEHMSINMGYFLEMMQPFKKDLKRGACSVEYRQKNPMAIVQFRIVANQGTYEVGIMPRKI